MKYLIQRFKSAMMKEKSVKHVAISIMFFICYLGGQAQSSSWEIVKEQMVKDWERARVYTKEYLDVMPSNSFGFKAADSIRSFAQLMLHLAQANVAFVSVACEKTNPLTRKLESVVSAQSKDSVIYFVMESYDYTINAIKAIASSKLSENVTAFGFTETRYAALLKAFEHQTHHRGQATIYVRLLGIKPPNGKLF